LFPAIGRQHAIQQDDFRAALRDRSTRGIERTLAEPTSKPRTRAASVQSCRQPPSRVLGSIAQMMFRQQAVAATNQAKLRRICSRLIKPMANNSPKTSNVLLFLTYFGAGRMDQGPILEASRKLPSHDREVPLRILKPFRAVGKANFYVQPAVPHTDCAISSAGAAKAKSHRHQSSRLWSRKRPGTKPRDDRTKVQYRVQRMTPKVGIL